MNNLMDGGGKRGGRTRGGGAREGSRRRPQDDEYDEEAAQARPSRAARSNSQRQRAGEATPGRARAYRAAEEEDEPAERPSRSRPAAGRTRPGMGSRTRMPDPASEPEDESPPPRAAARARGGPAGRNRGSRADQDFDNLNGNDSDAPAPAARGRKGGRAAAVNNGGSDSEPSPPPPPKSTKKGKKGADDDDIEGGGGPKDQHMEAFYQQVKDIKDVVQTVQDNISILSDVHEKTKTVTRPAQMKKLKEQMGDQVEEVAKGAVEVKRKLQNLERENEKSRKRPGCGPNSGTDRTRTSMTNGLKRKLKETMTQFNDLKGQVHDDYKETIERRFYTVTGKKPTDDQVEDMIESGQAEAMIQKAILNQGRGQIMDTLAEINERHEAIKNLEKSLMELHQIFLDMAVLVEAQGEVLDNIETHVSKSADYVQQGTKYIGEAKEYQKNTRKWMCCAIFIVISVALVLGLVLGMRGGKKKKKLLRLLL